MLPETRVWTRDEMMQRVALFKNLIGNTGGLPDSHLPEAKKKYSTSSVSSRRRAKAKAAGW